MTIALMALSPADTAFSILRDWVTLLFWSVDMVMSCITGTTVEGFPIMTPCHIRKILDSVVPFGCNRGWFGWVFAIMAWRVPIRAVEVKRVVAGHYALYELLVGLTALVDKVQRVLSMLRDSIESEMMFIL
jgi:hypothetical protein